MPEILSFRKTEATRPEEAGQGNEGQGNEGKKEPWARSILRNEANLQPLGAEVQDWQRNGWQGNGRRLGIARNRLLRNEANAGELADGLDGRPKYPWLGRGVCAFTRSEKC